MAFSPIEQLMLPQMGSAVLETLLNQLIARSQNTAAHLQRLNERVLRLELNAPHIEHFLVFSATRVEVLNRYDGEVDCHVITNPSVLVPPPKKAQLSELINDKRIVLHGDLQVLQDFTALLNALERNPAELVAPYVGDVLAHKGTRLVSQAWAFFKQQSAVAQGQWGERLSEEWQVAMPATALSSFAAEVRALAQDEQRLAGKIAHLSAQLKEPR
ncbi:SCP2 sterol-binding domain-containing protein [Pasteurellaceae bacterium 20609_3]|uniref:ubiquinone biosynthesis accessory factor UbiJ n=1 Tax=Spirabiliibacterium mucosae TaxID=28156 RepID=UPI001AAD4EA8|nr:SCP2 sterol-binding domain-containing protein [Spirabiliibacterium mucosae]MBE2899094.1 SCP2 sterol-binding domain-containing protein [Spirabiliibacterium mucosae]